METQVFSKTLPDIEEVAPLNEQDFPIMEEIYQVLKRHGALKRFGVALLHQHFKISEEEILLETTDKKNRLQIIKPVKKEEVEKLEGKDTQWRLDTGLPVMRCKCLIRSGEHVHVYSY